MRYYLLALSHIQQICSRRLWQRQGKSTENPFKWKNNNWIDKTWWKKEILLVFKKLSAAEVSESVYIRERVKTIWLNSWRSNDRKWCEILYHNSGIKANLTNNDWTYSGKVSHLLNPYPHTTILQQTNLNIFCQNIENLYYWRDNLWLKVENIVAKGEMAHFEQFLHLSLCFQKAVSAAEASERERVKPFTKRRLAFDASSAGLLIPTLLWKK